MMKEQQKQHLIDMMKQDEELGMYDEPLRKQLPANVEGSKEFNEMCKEEQTKCYCGHTITCDCGPEQETNLDKHLNSLTECPGPRSSAIVSKQEILLEDVFNEEKKKGVKELIDKHKQETLEEVKQECRITKIMQMDAKMAYDSLPKQETLEEVAERLKGKELFKESNDRARKTLSEIKSLPIQERSYSEEEVIQLVSDWTDYRMSEDAKSKVTFKKWFEQFKKK